MEKQTIKFTNDGKKVAVIQEINSSQFLVQEIFVDPETKAEAPGGELFVVPGLFEKPKKSWRQEETEKWERRYEEAKERCSREIDIYEKRRKDAIGYLQESTNYIRLVAKAESPEIQTLLDLLAGEIQFFVHTNDWRGPRILTWVDVYTSDRWDSGIRLISLFGKDDGTFTWKRNEYRDGSGSWSEIIPCKTREEALEICVRGMNEKKDFGMDLLKNAKSLGVLHRLDAEKIDAFRLRMEATARTKKERLLKEIAEMGSPTEELDRLFTPETDEQ